MSNVASIPEALNVAVQHHQAGRLQQAEQIYRQILNVDPQHADALHLLGLIALQVGKHHMAADYIGRALQANPNVADYHSNLGVVYRELKKPREATACYRRVVALKPGDAVAHNNLGIASVEEGNLHQAEESFRQALHLKPDYAEACNNLGSTLKQQGKRDDALACYRQAALLKPDNAQAHYNLGITLREQGNLDDAIASYRRALALSPNHAEAHNNLGNALKDQGKLDDAIACYRQALQLKPNAAVSHNNLGWALEAQGRWDEALACYRQAVQLKPDWAEAHTNLGNVLQEQEKIAEATACYQRALQLKPDFVSAHINLGNVYCSQGNPQEAAACYRRAMQLMPDDPNALYNLALALWEQGQLDDALASFRRLLDIKPDLYNAHSRWLKCEHFHPAVTLASLAKSHRQWDERHAAPLRGAWKPHENARDPQRRLRLGWISADFVRNGVGSFLVRPLEALDPQQCDIVCYSEVKKPDALTQRIKAVATTWREVARLSDEALAEQIRMDRIDILFDLSGHNPGNRMLVFARKPAPMQVTWIGYPGTTGLAAMDYILADRHEIPPELEAHYWEKVLRVPDSVWCYDPPDYAQPVGPLPALEKGYVTFGSLNRSYKITAEVATCWAEILRRVPDSRLLLAYKGFTDPSVARRLRDTVSAHGVDPARLDLQGWSPHREMLTSYHKVDVALDPFPHNGCLTTCEALWMGVPVITSPGETFAGRHSLSILAAAGMEEMIAPDRCRYVELAVEFASDLPRLAQLRAHLRERLAASPVCDGKRFGKNLLHLLRNA